MTNADFFKNIDRKKKFSCEGGFDCKSEIYEKIIETMQEEINNYKTIISRKNFQLDELRKKGF